MSLYFTAGVWISISMVRVRPFRDARLAAESALGARRAKRRVTADDSRTFGLKRICHISVSRSLLWRWDRRGRVRR